MHPVLLTLRDHLRGQFLVTCGRSGRFYAAHLQHCARVEFLRTPSEGRTETGVVKCAAHIAAAPLREASIAASSAPVYLPSAANGKATGETVAQIFVKSVANRK